MHIAVCKRIYDTYALVYNMSERICRYNCNMKLGNFDTKQNKYLELDGKTLHTRERCESLKAKQEHSKEAKIANIVKMIQAVVAELESLK